MTEALLNLIEVIKEKGVKPYIVQKSAEDTKMADVVITSPKNENIVGFNINKNNLEKPYGLYPFNTPMSLEDVKDFMTGFAWGESLRPKEEIG